MDDTPAYIKAIYDLDDIGTSPNDALKIWFLLENTGRIEWTQGQIRFSRMGKVFIRKMVAKYLGEQRVAEMMGQTSMEFTDGQI